MTLIFIAPSSNSESRKFGLGMERFQYLFIASKRKRRRQRPENQLVFSLYFFFQLLLPFLLLLISAFVVCNGLEQTERISFFYLFCTFETRVSLLSIAQYSNQVALTCQEFSEPYYGIYNEMTVDDKTNANKELKKTKIRTSKQQQG